MILPAFVTVHQREGTEGSEYVLRHDNGQEVSLFDGDDDYWLLANLIDRAFTTDALNA